MHHDAVLPVRISENLREDMFDQAHLGQYGKFPAGIGGVLGRTSYFVSRKCNCGESIVLLISCDRSPGSQATGAEVVTAIRGIYVHEKYAFQQQADICFCVVFRIAVFKCNAVHAFSL